MRNLATNSTGTSMPLTAALVEAIETMAFLSPDPLDDASLWSANLNPICRVTIPFTGPLSGTVQLIAPRALGEALVASLFGAERDQGREILHADDALQELGNIVAGLALRKVSELPGEHFHLSLPIMQRVDGFPADMLNAPHGRAALSVEGLPLLIKLDFDAHPVEAPS